jgi:hypothetical protein
VICPGIHTPIGTGTTLNSTNICKIYGYTFEFHQGSTPGFADSAFTRSRKKGRERLTGWLAMPPQPEIPCNEMPLKLFFGEHVSAKILIAYVERFRAPRVASISGEPLGRRFFVPHVEGLAF